MMNQNKNWNKNKKRKMMAALTLSIAFGIQLMPVQMLHAAQVRQEETGQLLGEALENLEEGTYEEGEALVSIEISEQAQTPALAKEGVYRYDDAVSVEQVSDFGIDEQTGCHEYVVQLASETYTAEELMELALQQYYVDGVSANGYQRLMSADPYVQSQWYLDGAGTGSKGIRFSQQTVQAVDTPVIAVIDTGVDYTHPDLADSMWVNPYPGKLEGTYGYDFGDGDADPMDTNGHGTHVSGIAAASQDNGVGICGVSQAKIMALKVVQDDSEEITDATIIAAYEYVYQALQAGVNVKAVNCSWGGSYDTNGMLSRAVDAVGELGALSVFAAGNDHTDWDLVRRGRPTPYDLESPYVVIVGASNESDTAAFYSDYGAQTVDLFAPGSNILSTYTTPVYVPGIYSDEKRQELTVYYNRFGDDAKNILPAGQTWKNFYTAADLGLATDYSVDIQTVKNQSNGYLKLTVTRRAYTDGGEAAGSVYVDVTDLQLDQSAVYYVGFMDGEGSGSEVNWQSEMMVSTPQDSRFVTVGEKTYLRIVGLSIPKISVGKAMTWYLDDIAISAANVDKAAFGAYTYQEGTSMAAPVVSAAVATLAAANPGLSAQTVRGLLLKSVRKVDSLSDKCISGGILDLSKMKVLATKVTLNRTRATLHYKKTLTLTAKVTPSRATNRKVKWTSSNTKYAVVNSNGVVRAKKAGIGHTVKITATAADGSKKRAVCTIKLKQ